MRGREVEAPAVAQPRFYKGHGLGNDYLVFEAAGEGAERFPPEAWSVTPAAIRAVCDRWTGVGADGIVVLGEPEADGAFPLRMFNPDGSEFERSGNGLRVLASHLSRTERVAREPFRVRSGGSVIGMQVHGVEAGGRYDVSVEMGRASTGPRAVRLVVDPAAAEARLTHPGRGPVPFHPVSVGNPHAVVFTDDLSAENLRDLGPFLSEHPAFHEGTNVQLAHVVGAGRVRIAIWERGVGRTSASGTSSCAVAVACVHRGLLDPGTIEVEMEGGVLAVTVGPELDVVLRGPVQEVVTGRLAAGFLRSLPR